MVDRALINYIKDGLSKGYSKEELKKILLENGWSIKEAMEALSIVSRMPVQQKTGTQTQQPQRKLAVTSLTTIERDRLVPFMKAALNKEIDREDIKFALIKKGWPEDKVMEAFRLVDIEKEEAMQKPVEYGQYKPESGFEFDPKRIMSYILSFILMTLVIGATVSLLMYVIAITEYKVIDPKTGSLVKGACLEEKCADMKRHAFMEIGLHPDATDRGNLWTAIIIGAVSALIILLAFIFVSFRTALLWVVNLLYFMFICYIAYLWIRFNYITLG
ncbi:MAG: hypothetical protein ABIH25_00120 [Candidatus Woesearchaeota archaeon]